MSDSEKAPAIKVDGPLVMQQLRFLTQVAELRHHPREHYVYKPYKDGSGTALKVQLRLVPTFHEKGYISDVDGGLFIELASQLPAKGADGFARFGWEEKTKVVAKLGVPDITAILAGIRDVRYRGKATPKSTRTKSDTDGTTVGMFHKFDNSSTAIAVKFAADHTELFVSKSKDLKRGIKLTLQEEVAFELYLRMALTAFLELGA
jgi:hypothetical protein